MTVKIRCKNIRFRGYSTHGWGHKKKHRGAGSRGGRGRAGLHKHKFVYALVNGLFHNGRLAEFGFKSKPAREAVRVINLFQIEELAKGRREVDISEYGYAKVLGRGRLTKPLTIKAEYFSASAVEKIKAAGGKAVGAVQEEAPEEALPKEEKKEEKKESKPKDKKVK
ncbi:MAG: uL15m family ribosomal protein [archaeon]